MNSLSIITVNFNNCIGLEKTITSVLGQSFKNFEFIIIDGNSNDGSKELIERHADQLAYWVSESDTGIYNAMNKGIRAAKSEYLLFLNSGDSLYHQNTLFQFESFIDGRSDIYYGDIMYNEPNHKTRRSFPKHLTFSFFLEHSISHQASFIRKSLFDKFFYYNEEYSIISDWEFFIYAICKRNVTTQYIPFIITDYDGGGLSSDVANHPKMHEERESVIQKYFPAFIDDYKHIKFLESKRGKQILAIKNNGLFWRLFKNLINLFLIFLPKKP